MTEQTTGGDPAEGAGAPGWDAIDAALAPLYRDQEPRHWGTIVSFRLGGPDPLQGISAYARTSPVPHWHYVTYGFSDLYEKEAEGEVSGYGFELTLRLAGDVGQEPPTWPIGFLQNLARYVFRTGNVFRPGEYLPLNGPIALDEPTLITDVIFTADPELPRMTTPNGRVDFVQVVGVTGDEGAAGRRWSSTGLLEAISDRLPLGVTDLARGSLLGDGEVRRAIDEGLARDGSTSGHMMTDVLGWGVQPDRPGTTFVTVGARQMRDLLDLLPLRLPYGRPYTLSGPEAAVTFRPGDADGVTSDGPKLTVTLTEASLHDLLERVPARRGSYVLASWPGLVVHVLATEIKGQDGSVVEVIG